MRALTFLLASGLALSACQPSDPATPEAPEVPAQPGMEAPAPVTLINLNTATEEDFKTVPGVGDKMAHEFDEYRPYTSVAEFRRQIGKYIDDDAEILDGYLAHVFVPVDPNASDAETLMQLPGVGEAEAAALIDGRPYATPEAFMTRYSEIAAEGDAVGAAAYLAQE